MKPSKKRRADPSFSTQKVAIEDSNLGGIVATALVTEAIQSCTVEEKLLITTLIPEFLKIIRSGGNVVIGEPPEGAKLN